MLREVKGAGGGGEERLLLLAVEVTPRCSFHIPSSGLRGKGRQKPGRWGERRERAVLWGVSAPCEDRGSLDERVFLTEREGST